MKEVDAAHFFRTLIQFHSACHLISQHTSTCMHNNFTTHAPTYLQKSCGDGRVAKDTLGAVVADLHAGGSVLYIRSFSARRTSKQVSRLSD